MQKSAQWMLLIGFMMLWGCTSSLPHPEVSSPKVSRSGIRLDASGQDFSQMQWWRNVNDPVLTQLIHDALIYNNQIKTAGANVLQAQAKLAEARFAWLPTLSASGNGFIGGGWDTDFTPQGPLANSPVFTQLGSLHFKGFYSGFVPTYSLNLLGNLHQTRFAQASLDLQQANCQSARLSVISQMSGAYFMLLGQRAQLADERRLILDVKALRRLEQIRYKRGASDLSAVTQLDQQLAALEAQIPAIESSIAQIENAIQVLLNRNPGPVLKRGRLARLSVSKLMPARVPSSVLAHRPDIMIAQHNLKMAEENLGIAYSHYFPTLTLTGLLGGASAELEHLLTLSTGLWVAQAAATVPILNGVTYEQIQAAKAGYYAAFYTFVQTMRSAFAEVDNVLTHQQKVNQAYAAERRALQAAKRGYRLTLARFSAGAKDARDLAQAQLNRDQAHYNLTMAKLQQLDSMVQVYQTLAGGYLNTKGVSIC